MTCLHICNKYGNTFTVKSALLYTKKLIITNYITNYCMLFSKPGLTFMKRQLKPRCSLAYSTVVLCLFSKQTGKVEFFSTHQLAKNDVFLMSLFSLANDAF